MGKFKNRVNKLNCLSKSINSIVHKPIEEPRTKDEQDKLGEPEKQQALLKQNEPNTDDENTPGESKTKCFHFKRTSKKFK